ncbi:MAG TPA: hypothetical protein VEU51_06215 [Candidatus Acidoferrales bacterium]|nr:hypothetical protein [Candidatus Acidoferrales bacterium]
MKRAMGVAILAILSLVGRAVTVSAANCQAKLLNTANVDNLQGYRCTIVGSDSTNTSKCIEFGEFGTSAHFDGDDGFLTEALGCTCLDSGSVTAPKFDASSSQFACAGVGSATLFIGKISGKTLTGQAARANGTSYIYRCVKDNTCGG